MTELRVFYLKEKEQIDGFDPGDFDYIVVESEKKFPSIYAQLVEQGIAPGHIISRAYYDSHIQPGLFPGCFCINCKFIILSMKQQPNIYKERNKNMTKKEYTFWLLSSIF